MSQSSCSFADRIINIAVTGPVVRLELGTMTLQSGEGEKPRILPTQTIVMPLDGFVASVGMLESVIKKLVADGVLKARPPETQPGPATGTSIQ